MQLSGRGVAMSLFASLLFAIIPGYVQFLSPLNGIQVFAQRLLWSLPVLLVLVIITGHWVHFRICLRKIKRRPLLLLAVLATAFIMGSQWMLFVWAPLSGHMLDLTLGYFLMPLVLVLTGRVFYNERLRPLQQAAVVFACAGVVHEVLVVGSMSWVTLVTAFGYPPYFMLRRWMKFDAFSGFLIEIIILTPMAIWLIMQFGEPGSFTGTPKLWLLLPVLGLLSTLAFAAMMGASRLLPLGLLGILSYIEPVLLFLSSLWLVGETIAANQWWTYIPIWVAVVLVMLDSAHVLRKQAKRVYT